LIPSLTPDSIQKTAKFPRPITDKRAGRRITKIQLSRSGMNTEHLANRRKLACALALLLCLAGVGNLRVAQGQDTQSSGAGTAAIQAAPNVAEAGAPMVPEERLALVIGNSTYRDAPLGNPANDARAMAIKLKELGFKVIEREDASLEEMRKS